MLYFIYELYSTSTNEAGYIGLTNNPNARFKQHLETSDNNARKHAWIKRHIAHKREIKMRIVEVVEGEQQARERERYWIHYYIRQGIQLVNIQGVDGMPPVHFNGQVFASTIAAQWAFFFTQLGVPYEYKPHTYILNGIRYTPDFFLPEQDCFMRIGGLTSMEDHLVFSRLLALYAGKNVYTAYGNISAPRDDPFGEHWFLWDYPPGLYTRRRGTEQYETIALSVESLLVLQELEDLGLKTRRFTWANILDIEPIHPFNFFKETEKYLQFIQRQAQILPTLIPRIQAASDEITQAYQRNDEYELEFNRQETHAGIYLVDCKQCKKMSFAVEHLSTYCRFCDQAGLASPSTPRLISSYETARSARFE